ncbi:germinal-center associated nuclear protein [Episyrphus balteatus]|uniref:germinal-center associated nuclear protein n=1 Tax=Episyrphus balteatus TaxID=286459 RepID=UPI002485397D|nr:germinal-center associated nuclear protein [Episyrphus balteatus]
MPEFVQGTCEEMCPEQEVKLRTKERLLHFYECKPGQKNVPGILVKSFSRSAAGIKIPRKKDLRTQRSLNKTVEYLLKEITLDKRRPFNYVYDFVFDRLRAIRQEIVMQNYDAKATIRLLEPMIMFLAYSRYRLCEESVDNFDPKICEQHLQECLKRVLCCYDEIHAESGFDKMNLSEIRSRNFIESIYQLFNLGSIEALKRSAHLPAEIKTDPVFAGVYSIALNHFQGNFYKVLQGIARLPHILCAIASLKLQIIRRQVFLIFASAYSSKQLLLPVEWLRKLLLYSNKIDVAEDCKYFELEYFSEKEAIRFYKSDFKNENVAIKQKHEAFVEEKLKKIYLPEILLLKKL